MFEMVAETNFCQMCFPSRALCFFFVYLEITRRYTTKQKYVNSALINAPFFLRQKLPILFLHFDDLPQIFHGRESAYWMLHGWWGWI
jgi:hypothetical protein